MAKQKTGTFLKRDGKWFVRISWTDLETGKRRQKEKQCPILSNGQANRTEGKRIIRSLLQTLETHGQKMVEAEKMTFNHLADYYRDTYLVEPEYRDGRKVSGLRSWQDMRNRLAILQGHFGKTKIKDIAFSDLVRFRQKRLKTQTRSQSDRKVAGVNRELALLRRMLNVAVRNGWIAANPFSKGDSLVSAADEKRRDRVLTREETSRLLAACESPARWVYRIAILFALDCGLRRGEILKLNWDDIDFEAQTLTIQAQNSKTFRSRVLPLPSNCLDELRRFREISSPTASGNLVLTVKDIRAGYDAIRAEAGLLDVRFHDLRHTYATRLVAGGLALPQVSNALGHTSLATTFRYVNPHAEVRTQIVSIIDSFNDDREPCDDIVN